MIPLFKVAMSDKAHELVKETMYSGFVGQGPMCDRFERFLKDHFGTEYVALTNSCTSAIHLAIRIIKDKEGLTATDEVLSPALSCLAMVSPVLANDLRLKWVDIDPSTCNIDIIDLERKLSKDTRILIFVHWGGYPVDINKIKQLKIKYRETFAQELYIIHDCAHCWDTRRDDKLIGSNGEDYYCFSFQAIKFLQNGDGGCLITPNHEDYKKSKLIRWFGLDRESGGSFRCQQNLKEGFWGYKMQPNDLLSSIGIANWDLSFQNVEKHRINSSILRTELLDVSGLNLLNLENGVCPSYWIFSILVEDRANFQRAMADREIETSPVHSRMDKHLCMKDFRSFLPNMDTVEQKLSSVPNGWWLNEDQLAHIIDSVKTGW